MAPRTPGSPAARPRVAKSTAGKSSAEKPTAAKQVQRRRKKPEVDLAGALALHEQGAIAQALEAYRAMLLRDGESAQLAFLMGTAQVQLGELGEGSVTLRRALALQPDHPEALNSLANAMMAQDQPDEAIALYERAIQLRPAYADACNNLGTALSRAGRLEEALARYDAAIAAQPAHGDALANRANVLRDLGRLGEARTSLEQALSVDPRRPDLLMNLGNLQLELGRAQAAQQSYERALDLRPEHPRTLFGLGNALSELALHDAALARYDHALRLAPDYAQAWLNRGNVLRTLGRLEDARQSYEQAVAAKSDYLEGWLNLGNVLGELQRSDEAIAAYDRAITLRPDSARAHFDRGNRLAALSRLDEALESFGKAIEAEGDHFTEARLNHGWVLTRLGRHEEALQSYERAIDAQPDDGRARWARGNALARVARDEDAVNAYAQAEAAGSRADVLFNKSLALLRLGRLEEGWPLYEWRLQAHAGSANHPELTGPVWCGETPIHGKRVLVHPEQGFGDVIQFCRYLPMLEMLGAEVVFRTPEPLIPLLSTLSGRGKLIARNGPLPRFDVQCRMMSLPLAFGTRLGTIPAQVPYLRADPQRVARMATRLGPKRGLRVGLAWSGSPAHKNDANRSLPLAKLHDLLRMPIDWHSLQKDYRANDLEVLASLPALHRHEPVLKDFADTAALILQMDLVICVDTSIAHLAGALGRPVWILLPYAPDWRWLLERTDSPWYPTARLFRQTRPGDWDALLARVGAALRAPIDRDA